MRKASGLNRSLLTRTRQLGLGGFAAIVCAGGAALGCHTEPTGPQQVGIGADGGTVSTAAGDQLVISPGTFTSTTQVTLDPVSQSTVEQRIQQQLSDEGLRFLRALDFETDGATPNHRVQLSLQNSFALPADGLVLALIIVPDLTGDSVADLQLVDVGQVQGGRIVIASPYLSGVRATGTIVVVQTTQPWGFFSGTVTDSLNHLVSQALAFTLEVPEVLGETDSSGVYVLAAPATLDSISIVAEASLPALGVVSLFARSPTLAPVGLPQSNAAGFMRVPTPPPGSVLFPPKPITPALPISGGKLLQLVQDDLKNKCDNPDSDRWLRDALRGLFNEWMDALRSAADSDYVSISPSPVVVTLDQPPTTVSVDLSAYLNGHLEFQPEFKQSLGPYYRFEITVKITKVSLLTWQPFAAPISLDPSIASVNNASFSNQLVTELVTGQALGETSLIGDIPQLDGTIEVGFSVTERNSSCDGDGPSLSVNFKPATSSFLHLLPDPVTVTSTAMQVLEATRLVKAFAGDVTDSNSAPTSSGPWAGDASASDGNGGASTASQTSQITATALVASGTGTASAVTSTTAAGVSYYSVAFYLARPWRYKLSGTLTARDNNTDLSNTSIDFSLVPLTQDPSGFTGISFAVNGTPDGQTVDVSHSGTLAAGPYRLQINVSAVSGLGCVSCNSQASFNDISFRLVP